MKLNVILFRYLFIFLFFAVFLLLFFIPIYGYVTNFTLQNELVHISNRMEQGIISLNSMLTALDLASISINNNSRFSILRAWNINQQDLSPASNIDPNILLELRNFIHLALLPHPLSADSGLLFPEGLAVTRNNISIYPSPVPFYGYFLQCRDLTLEEWYNLLAGSSSFIPVMPYTSAYYGSYEAVTYTVNWAYTGSEKRAIIFVTLPVKGIVALLSDTDVAEAAYIRMYDAGENLLFSHGAENSGPYHVVSDESSVYSLKFKIGIPDSFIANKLQPIRNMIVIFICITVFLVLILSFLFAWRSSQTEISFLKQIRSNWIINSGFNIFSGFKRIYQDTADTITEEKSQLEISLRTIKVQTALIQTQTIERLRKAILSGDETLSRTILSDCVATLPNPEDPLIAAFFSHMISDMIQDLRKELPEAILPEEIPEYVPGLQEELFNHYYPNCFTRICKNVQANREKKISPLGRKVKTYIDEEINNPNMYITMVTDHFHISTPTLQKLVKESTGQTFQNYVEKCRISRAHDLLLNSTDSISEIAITCGYSSTASFSRSFKQIYGFSPSRMRSM